MKLRYYMYVIYINENLFVYWKYYEISVQDSEFLCRFIEMH